LLRGYLCPAGERCGLTAVASIKDVFVVEKGFGQQTEEAEEEIWRADGLRRYDICEIAVVFA
jgi:hypothetical protein